MAGTLHVYTYKDGLLARLAHDLRLTVGRFSVVAAGGKVTASFDPASARVDGVASGDRVDPGGLSDKDKRTIETTLTGEILETTRHPTVTFEGAVVVGTGPRARGTLGIRGRRAEIDLPILARPGELVVEGEIVPSRWGIAPYRALGGALKLQDRWRVRLVLPWDGPRDGLGAIEGRWGG